VAVQLATHDTAHSCNYVTVLASQFSIS
jgi:hypothetical protein